ncbi:uncharacterized protein RHOBADRAFT_45049 [Rhodotorula graminis WP1]|uniref:Uncharacterized protein n=1 Tax=Rhodotorula graminis (strain WP1) TaxID=578459 RepID=A0A194S216_RHOGW|nr:uncharacterized protein RHOBADRAFT_45049 [Rhodotorula graminis WP1]KPV74559.1 hypothetical protein RHOBADRAFT_45049 [Rhodotorula graminis WP1]
MPSSASAHYAPAHLPGSYHPPASPLLPVARTTTTSTLALALPVPPQTRLWLGSMPDAVFEGIAHNLACDRGPESHLWSAPSRDLVVFASLSRAARRASRPYLFTTLKIRSAPATLGVASASGPARTITLGDVHAVRLEPDNLAVANLGAGPPKIFMTSAQWRHGEQDGRALAAFLEDGRLTKQLRRVRLETDRLPHGVIRRIGRALSTCPELVSLHLDDLLVYDEPAPRRSTGPPVLAQFNKLQNLQIFGADYQNKASKTLVPPDLSALATLRTVVLSRSDIPGYTCIKSLKPHLSRLTGLALVGGRSGPNVDDILKEISTVPTATPFAMRELVLSLETTEKCPQLFLRPALAVVGRTLRVLCLINFGKVSPDDCAVLANVAPQLTTLIVLASDGAFVNQWPYKVELYLAELKKLKGLRRLAWDKAPDAKAASRAKKNRRRTTPTDNQALFKTRRAVELKLIGRVLAKDESLISVFVTEGRVKNGWLGTEGTFNPASGEKVIIENQRLDLDQSIYSAWEAGKAA